MSTYTIVYYIVVFFMLYIPDVLFKDVLANLAKKRHDTLQIVLARTKMKEMAVEQACRSSHK